MKQIAILATGLFLSVVSFTLPVKAETLPIQGAYPATNDQLSALNTLAVRTFYGQDGQAFAIELEQKLKDVSVRGAPYFNFAPVRGKLGPDGIIGGSANSGLETRHEQARRQECAFRDGNGNCKERRWVNILCTRQIITLNYTLTVEGRRRERIFGVTKTAVDSTLICPDSGEVPAYDIVVEHLISGVAAELRLQFAPLEVRDDIRVKEGTEGLQNNAKKKFKDAIHLTKQNTQSACTEWAEVDQLVPNHSPTLFNLGLCAESRADYNGAEAFYRRVEDLNRSERYATEAIERLNRLRQAERQIAAHISNAKRTN